MFARGCRRGSVHPTLRAAIRTGRDQFISIEAAHWAVMALTRLLPEVPAEAPLPLAFTEEHHVEPWAETAMFGTVDDLRKLLDEGLSSNVFTAEGHIPLLSLVVPDVDKTNLLISRGADVNARSSKRFSPLVIASQYLSGTSAVKALMAAGATVRPPSGVRVDAFPTFLCSCRERIRAGEPALPPAVPTADLTRVESRAVADSD